MADYAKSGTILGGLLGGTVGLGANLMSFTVSGAGPVVAASASADNMGPTPTR